MWLTKKIDFPSFVPFDRSIYVPLVNFIVPVPPNFQNTSQRKWALRIIPRDEPRETDIQKDFTYISRSQWPARFETVLTSHGNEWFPKLPLLSYPMIVSQSSEKKNWCCPKGTKFSRGWRNETTWNVQNWFLGGGVGKGKARKQKFQS